MSQTWAFLTRTSGRNSLTWTDYASYAYLALGFLLIFLPVMWIGLNSVKSSFQLDSQDLSLLPTDYQRVARATVNGPDGKEIFIISDLPDWVLNWKDLNDDQKAAQDIDGLLARFEGRDFYALRSHLGRVSTDVRALVEAGGVPDWVLKYTSMTGSAKAEIDVEATLSALGEEDRRLVAEFLNFAPYTANRVVSQVLVNAPDPETGAARSWAVPSVTGRQEFLPGRALDGDGSVTRLPRETVEAERTIRPSWGNYTEPLEGASYGVNVNFAACITNSVLVTVIATLITLLINSMAAFALS
ncbi:MAG: carbohydrate ABC transporter permease, partial [Pseudomonadota bacterium]